MAGGASYWDISDKVDYNSSVRKGQQPKRHYKYKYKGRKVFTK
jgi:hypothetical protein